MNRTFPKTAEEFLDEAQQYVVDTGKKINAIDGSKQWLFLFGNSEREWAFRLTQVKAHGFNPLLVDHFQPGKREILADLISGLQCLRPYGAKSCRCGSDICVVSEVLLT